MERKKERRRERESCISSLDDDDDDLCAYSIPLPAAWYEKAKVGSPEGDNHNPTVTRKKKKKKKSRRVCRPRRIITADDDERWPRNCSIVSLYLIFLLFFFLYLWRWTISVGLPCCTRLIMTGVYKPVPEASCTFFAPTLFFPLFLCCLFAGRQSIPLTTTMWTNRLNNQDLCRKEFSSNDAASNDNAEIPVVKEIRRVNSSSSFKFNGKDRWIHLGPMAAGANEEREMKDDAIKGRLFSNEGESDI